MTVCTHEIALGDLVEDGLSAESPDHHAHLAPLISAGAVVEGHCRLMEDAAAVGARLSVFEGLVPGSHRDAPLPLLLTP
jgi:hypothetical protein